MDRPVTPLTFKIATEDSEFEQIHLLNYETFVEEIPQHERNASRRLVDKYHSENTYLICLAERQLVGMVAMRDRRPFSLDAKVPRLDAYLPPNRNVCEIRLLSIRPHKRRSMVLLGLLRLISVYGRQHEFNLAIISGTTRELKMYTHIGFVPFGPLVGTPEARYQPMYITLEKFDQHVGSLLTDETQDAAATVEKTFPESFLPGPVAIRKEVHAALGGWPVSHRSAQFVAETQSLKQQLCRIVKARHCEIMLGTGTLGNDTVAWQLTLMHARGLILTNGEFGERLTDHATRASLTFDTLRLPWGSVVDRVALEARLDRTPDVKWIWCAHCETSTGVLNDLALLQAVCDQRQIKLCLDCASSIGTVAVDLSRTYFAATVSGKGLGSFPGLALVFYNHAVEPATTIPRYLDVGLYARQEGIPFTHSSNLHAALRTAVRRFTEREPPYAEIAALGAWLRMRLREMNFELVAPEEHASPAIVTIALPPAIPAPRMAGELEESGYHLSHRSQYLRDRNWIQISLMGDCSQARLLPLLDAMQPYAPSDQGTPVSSQV
jgi:aspartate aminotransferase-like enzyme